MIPKPKRLTQSPGYHHAKKQEKKTALRVGGVTTLASGSKGEKGDSRIRGVVRIENKCTQKESFRVTRDMIAKIENAALGAGEVPVIEIEFLGKYGGIDATVCVIPTYALDLLLSKHNE